MASLDNTTANAVEAPATAPAAEPAEIVQISVLAAQAAGIKAQQERTAAACQRIAKLSAARQSWQDTVYKTSNEMLYAILQDCYRLYDDMLGASVVAGALRTALDLTLTERKIPFEKTTHTMTKIVRCVFDGDRRRINAYSLALRAAFNNKPVKVPVDELASFIAANGGVEELRMPKSTTAVTLETKLDMAKSMLGKKELAVVASAKLSEDLDGTKVGEQHVLIVTQLADGSLAVNGMVSTTAAVNAALTAYYMANKTPIAAAAAGAAEVAKQSETAAVIEAMVAQAA